MNKAQIKKFRALLEEKRDEIIKKAKQTLDEDMTLDANDLPDEMDLASSEYLQSFTFRLRGREKGFLDKINRHTSILRVIHYPELKVAPQPGEERSAAHTDTTAITILRIDDAPGGLLDPIRELGILGGAWAGSSLRLGTLTVLRGPSGPEAHELRPGRLGIRVGRIVKRAIGAERHR